MSLNEFIQDIKNAAKTKDISVVREKYLKPAYQATKSAAAATWHFIEVNTPKVIAAGKEAISKGKESIDKMKSNKANAKSGANPPSDTTQTNQTSSKTSVDQPNINIQKPEQKFPEDKNPPPQS